MAIDPVFLIIKIVIWILLIIHKKEKSTSPIINLSILTNGYDEKTIIIPNLSLAEDYSVKNEEILYGLFTNDNQFEKIMRSGGNSILFIHERDKVPSNIKHYSGEKGKFNYGLYCEHPKDKNILIPMNNYDEIIKDLILEETLRIYATLGAKSIIIEDITSVDVFNNTTAKGVDVNGNVKYGKEILRSKTFGKVAFNPDKVFENIYFAPDFPNIMTVAEARINGNQLSEEFSEKINLNVGLDIDVVGLFRNETNFNYERKWHFKVEFYDKNEL
jgi:hypothetical protein